MPDWPQWTPAEQNELLGEITLKIVDVLPVGWQQLMIDYRVVGRNIDVAVGVRDDSGQFRSWQPPAEVWKLFARLRKGMYREGEGTWFSARFTIDPPSKFSVQYNWTNEPRFEPYPAPEEFVVEQRRFPREEQYMPDWYRARLAAATGQ